jgi:short subunit dehydrogenase-like uncharacterized protein
MTNGRTERDFDLVLFGATGFTGRLVAEHLVRRRGGLRLALAGRSREKLERVRGDLAAIDAAARDLPLLVADALDPASIGPLARRARVVCSTVGPFARYGRELARACAESGTDYCDSTGEPQFVRFTIDACHARAAETGARLVSCCGFDSVPSDLGVFLLHEALSARGKQLAEAHLRLRRAKGGVSGGTIASMLALVEEARDPAVRRVLGDPYGLCPGEPRGPDGSDSRGPRRDADTGRFTAPFVMAAINTRVVRRTNALLGYPYGRDFRYDEAVDTGRGALGLARAVAMSAGIGGALALAAIGPGRRLLERVVPAPGEGPSRRARDRGSFRVEVRGVSTDGERLVAIVSGERDPGYAGTAILVGESALCLAEDALGAKGGVLTPASCMGHALVERLRAQGIRLEVAPDRASA